MACSSNKPNNETDSVSPLDNYYSLQILILAKKKHVFNRSFNFFLPMIKILPLVLIVAVQVRRGRELPDGSEEAFWPTASIPQHMLRVKLQVESN